MIQDIIISVGMWIFFIALIPSIKSKDKPTLWTSIPTCMVLIVYAFTFATMELWLSVASNILTASAWLTLAIQKYMQKTRIPAMKN